MLNKALLPPKPSEPVIFVNGEFLPQSQAKISVLDHGLMYGDGCFDAWCGKNGFIFQHEMHTQRLFRSIHSLKLDRWMKMSYDDMFKAIIETVRRNVLPDFYIKVLVTRGASPEPVLDPRECPQAGVVIFARPTVYKVDLRNVASRAVRVKILATRRVSHDSLEPKVKSLNYLNIVMGKLEAWDSGYDDGILVDSNGYIGECAGFNIMGVRGKTLFTPAHGMLEGITRASVMEMAREAGMQVETGDYSAYDFINADEVFMTNTVHGITPVTNIDGWKINGEKTGPYTQKFALTYLEWLESGRHGTQCFPEAWSR